MPRSFDLVDCVESFANDEMTPACFRQMIPSTPPSLPLSLSLSLSLLIPSRVGRESASPRCRGDSIIGRQDFLGNDRVLAERSP